MGREPGGVAGRARTRARNLAGYAFIAPWLIGFLGFTLLPTGASLYLAFKDYDILLCPVAASAAFPHDHTHEGKRWKRRITVNNNRVSPTDQLFWAGYSGLVFLPSTVGPSGITPSGHLEQAC